MDGAKELATGSVSRKVEFVKCSRMCAAADPFMPAIGENSEPNF